MPPLSYEAQTAFYASARSRKTKDSQRVIKEHSRCTSLACTSSRYSAYSGRPQLFLISLITKELWTEPRLSMVPRVLMRKLL